MAHKALVLAALFRSFSAVNALPQQSPSCVSVIVGSPAPYQYATSTQTLDATAAGYTSTATGVSTITAIIGQPAAYQTVATSTSSIPADSAASTTYITSGNTVTPIVFVPVPSSYSTASTSYTTLPANDTPLTSTSTSGNVVYPVVGTNAAYSTAPTSTISVAPTESASTTTITSGTIVQPIVYTPSADSTVVAASTLDTSSADSTVVAASTLDTSSAESTVVAASTLDTPSADSTVVAASTLDTPSADSTVVAASTLDSLGTVTTSSYFPGGTSYISTVSASGTVIYGYPQTYITTTVTSGTVATTATVSQSGTVPGTVIVAQPTPPTTCNNAGLGWALWINPNAVLPLDPYYSNYDPAVFKSIPPLQNATTSYIGGLYYESPIVGTTTIYNSIPFGSQFFTLAHRGYVFAPQTGSYTFTLDAVDDIAFVWIGPTAYSGWSNFNRLMKKVYASINTTASYDMTAGQYYPFRVQYANAAGLANFNITATAPDGSTFIYDGDSTQASNPYFVKYSCDGTTAPDYVDWGSEK